MLNLPADNVWHLQRRAARANAPDIYLMFANGYSKMGHFYTMGFPGVGEGVHGTIYICSDPEEYVQVIRGEGLHPSGAVETQWPSISALKRMPGADEPGGATRGALNIFGHGEAWRQERMFFQQDLQTPKAARGYIPGLAKAAQLASRGAPACADSMDSFAARSSFDLFTAAFFGQLIESADPATPCLPGNLEFAEAILDATMLLVPMLQSPVEMLKDRVGVESADARLLRDKFSVTMEHASGLVRSFVERWEAGELNKYEQASYLRAALDRRLKNEHVTEEALVGISFILLAASVDTTSSLVNWTLLQLAVDREAQRKLAAELQRELGVGGSLTPEVTQSGRGQWLPYLRSVVREVHRMRPSIPVSLMKRTATEVDMCGYTVPAGSLVMLDSFSPQNDPALVPDAHEFRPERSVARLAGQLVFFLSDSISLLCRSGGSRTRLRGGRGRRRKSSTTRCCARPSRRAPGCAPATRLRTSSC